MKKREDIDRLFRDALHDQESVPSPDLWNKISEQLDEEQKIVPMASARRRPIAWAKYAAAACLLIGLTVGYFAWQNDGITTESTLVQQDNKEATQEKRIADIMPTQEHREEPMQESTPVRRQAAEEMEGIIASVEQPVVVPPLSHIVEEDHVEFVDIQAEATSNEAPVVEDIQYAIVETPTELPTAGLMGDEIEPMAIASTESESRATMSRLFDEDENLIAETVGKTAKTVVGSLLDRVSDNISNATGKEVSISTDEEGSLRISNLFARNNRTRR